MRRLLAALLLVAPAARGGNATLEALLAQADSASWEARWEAVEGLARLRAEDVFQARAALLRDARPRAREAVAWACLLDPDLGNATILGLALRQDREAAVRRAAARALARYPDRRAVTALVEALATETDRRTMLQIVETLRALTPAPCLLDPAAWGEWWKRNEGDPRFAPADEPPRQGEYEGVKLETRTVAPVRTEKKGVPPPKPPHILVLPAFGFTTVAFGPYLLPLRDRAAITWVRLPGVQELTGRSGYGDDLPEYPVDRLVRALEAFRASLGIERFLPLANGASGWIALRYAVLHPDRCSGLILIDTPLDKQAYAEALRRGAARGDANERLVARTLLRETSTPFNEATLARLHAIGIEEGFIDGGDLEIAWLFHRARDPQGFATVPEISWSRHRQLDVPALFLYSASSPFSGHVDAERIRRIFPRSMVAPIRETKALPYVEENAKVLEVVADFLRRYGLAP